jgi:hypothetical protein
MASFNFENDGIPIAKIKIDGKKKDKIVSLDENSSSTNNYKEIILKPNQGKFQFIPDENKERFIAYVVGASGSGKSFFASQLGNEYKKMFPKNSIYLLSYLDNDSSIDQIKGIKRIKLDDEFLETDLDAEDFRDSLVIWDDTDCITDKKMVLKLRDLLGKMLNTGRHCKNSVIYLSHIACNGLQTKSILNETHSITFFNATLGGRTRQYLLNQYLGLNKAEIEALNDIQGRAITICKTYPMVLIAEREIKFIKDLGKKK